jgi:glycosyltransferase involved in cell wall biosynthesis
MTSASPGLSAQESIDVHKPVDETTRAADKAERVGQEVVMLLDNHYGPDPRVAFELEMLREAGVPARIIAWDRRSDEAAVEPPPENVIRIRVSAPSGGGRRSLVAACRFGVRVWRQRAQLFERAAILMVHDVYLLPLGWMLSRRLRKPFIYDAHEEYARMEAGRYPSWVLRFVTALESRLARGALAVVVPGRSRTLRWRGILKKPPIILPNLGREERPTSERGSPQWDLLYAGTLSEDRRPEILVELAHMRPELQIAIAGRGRSVEYVAQAAQNSPNLHFLGFRANADELFAISKAIYYGLDPERPYSEVACPNTLYQALVYRKPLIFFCGGEPAELAREFRIGIRCPASVAAVSAAVDRLATMGDWQFDEAWTAVWDRADTDEFIDAVKSALRQSA